MLRRRQLERALARAIAHHGAWTAHNIRLGGGVHTRGECLYDDELKVLRTAQLIEDLVRRPWSELRIVDLGCNEGLHACEFALRGAAVVGIEGRAANVERAQFARHALGLERLKLIRDDVRTLSPERHGGFNVVLCAGLLYHLDTPDVFDFVRRMCTVCEGMALIDTHVALPDEALGAFDADMFWVDPATLGPLESRQDGGSEYWGRSFLEHLPESTAEERLRSGWGRSTTRTASGSRAPRS
jgi:SAM-dependent methyltransferase